MTKRKLVLENGQTFTGDAFGADIKGSGEVIFFTGMSGYQEMITDPCYEGKVVVMTYPNIGAYGINRDDFEAITPQIKGLIVKNICEEPSNFRSEESLDSYLKRNDIPGLSGIDTRKLTKVIRKEGNMKGIIMDTEDEVQTNDFAWQNPSENELLSKVSISKPYIIPGRNERIVVIDLGIKQSILHELTASGCHITVVPYNYKLEEIKRFKPDTVLVSNGPGNPENMTETIQLIQTLIGKFPLLGIGLGHQLIALAAGAATEKLSHGQYGIQVPVTDLCHKKTWMTTVSHDYVVKEDSLPEHFTVSHRMLHDNQLAGLISREKMLFSVQFHPEGAPGTNEMDTVFADFLSELRELKCGDGGNQHA